MDRRDFLLAAGGATTGELLGLAPDAARKPEAEALLLAATEGGKVDKKSARPSLEHSLAAYAVGVRYADLPREIVAATKRLLLDTLACAFGAVGAQPAKIAEATFRKAYGGGTAASVIGGGMISTEGAALVNGVLVRYLDFNDTYVGSEPLHPGEIVPLALACCEEAGGSGRALVEALVVGYEGETRINDAFTFLDRGFHPLSAAGFVAPMVAGKAWQLPPGQIAQAIGISGTRELTMFVVNSGEISMMKALGHAYTCMDAVFSTRLAQAGFTGPSGTIEWLTTRVGPKHADVRINLDPGAYRLTRVFLKRFPLQFEMQAAVEACVNLHPAVRGGTDGIREVVIETYPRIRERTAGPEKYQPTTRESADHSLPICTAMALLDGDVNTSQFDRNRWRDRDVMAVAAKTTVKVGESLVARMPKGRGAAVEVRLGDGRVLKEAIDIPEGDVERPLSRAALERKFRQLAVPLLGEAGATQVIALVDNLENVEDVRAFTKALRDMRPKNPRHSREACPRESGERNSMFCGATA